MVDENDMPELNQQWFDKRFRAIRNSNLRQAEVELRSLIREIHVALRFRDVKLEARRRLDAAKQAEAARPRPRSPSPRYDTTWAAGVAALEQA